jgi:hypothetical protein
MEVNQIIEARKMLEQELFRLINHFELNSGCTVESIAIKHRRIEAGEASRNGLDKVTVRATLPSLSEGE